MTSFEEISGWLFVNVQLVKGERNSAIAKDMSAATRTSTSDRIHRCLHGVAYEIFLQSFFDSNAEGIGDINGLREKLEIILSILG